MEALHLRQYHHQQQTSQKLMTPISFSSSFRASTTPHCLSSIISKCFFTCIPKLSTSGSGKIEATARVSADVVDKLKENWLDSITCASVVTGTESPILDEGCGNGEVPSSNAGSRWVIGIDPDVSGALAVLKEDDSGCSSQVYDSPNLKMLVGKRIRRRLDTKAMVQLLRSFNAPMGTTAYIEQSLPYPGDGKQGWWSGGFNYGLWIGVLVASEISVIPVPSARWKNEFKLSGNGSTKDNSRELACTLFPSLSSSLTRKKDHGRAEALLIAAYGKGIKLNSDSASLSNALMSIET